MTIAVKHKFFDTHADRSDASLVRPSNWNDVHAITGAANTIFGFDGSGNPTELDSADLGALVSLVPNTTPITGGADTRILFDKSGTVGEDPNLTWNYSTQALAIKGGSSSAKLELSGNSIGGTSTGTGFAHVLGYNVTNNKQYWYGDPDYIGNVNGTFLRVIVQNGNLVSLDAVKGDGSAHDNFFIGNTDTVVDFNGPITIGPNTFDIMLVREAANTLAIGNFFGGSNANALHLYNTNILGSLPPTNFERGVFDWTSLPGCLSIGVQNGGTGSIDQLRFLVGVHGSRLDWNVTNSTAWSFTGLIEVFIPYGTSSLGAGGNGGGFYAGLSTDAVIGSRVGIFLDGSDLPVVGFGNGTVFDTGFSRVSAGIVALGNGTSGDTSGTLKATTLTAASAFNFGGSSILYPQGGSPNYTNLANPSSVSTGSQIQVGDVSDPTVYVNADDGLTVENSNASIVFGTIDSTGVTSPTFNVGNNTVLTGAAAGKFEVAIGGTNELDFGVTTASVWSLGAELDLKAGTTAIAPLKFKSGTNLTSATAGACEFDGSVFYHTSVASARQVVDTEQVECLSSTRTFANNTNAQAIFNLPTNGAVTLAASTTYEFEMLVVATGFSSSSHTLNLTFAAGGSFTSIGYYFNAQTGTTLATPTASLSGFVAVGTASAICASTTTTGLTLYVRGTMRIATGGTVTPQLTQVTASAAAVVQPNSFFRCWPIGSNTVTNVGNWS